MVVDDDGSDAGHKIVSNTVAIATKMTEKLLLLPGFLLDKKIGVNQPKRIENAKILVANTPMDADKVKVC